MTITGTNDAPVAQAIAAAASEDGPGVTLQADFADVDASDTHTFAVDTTATLGTVTNNGDGTFGYDPNGAFEALAEGETATDTFSYTVSDNNGGSSTRTATVTITGTNDAPVAQNATGAVQEDGQLTASGDLAAMDVDGDPLSFAIQGGGAGTYGALSVGTMGAWTYTLDNASPAVQSLGEGEVVLDAFTIDVSDDQGGTTAVEVAVTVTGAADVAPRAGVTVVQMTGQFQWGYTDWNAYSEYGNLNNETDLDHVSNILNNGYAFAPPASSGFDNVNGVYNAFSGPHTMLFDLEGDGTLVENFSFISSRSYGDATAFELEALNSGGEGVSIYSNTTGNMGVTTGDARAYHLDVADVFTDSVRMTISGSQLSLHEIVFNETLDHMLV